MKIMKNYKEKEKITVLSEFFKNSESWIEGSVIPMCVVGLWPMSGTRTQSPELSFLDRGKMPKSPDHAPDKQRGHGGIGRRCSGVATREDG